MEQEEKIAPVVYGELKGHVLVQSLCPRRMDLLKRVSFILQLYYDLMDFVPTTEFMPSVVEIVK
jgi:hypothetical protein